MAIKTNHYTVKSLFEQNHTFQVPKYQRGYAWEEEAIEDFTDDIGKCLAARLAGGKRHMRSSTDSSALLLSEPAPL